MDIKSIIQRKMEKQELTNDEIRYFVGKYAKGEISDAQVAALMSFIYVNGLNEDEILHLSVALADSGEKMNLDEISPNVVDKHSTGGVGDKVTILLMPVMAALGIPVAKVSSRGYGIAGGTIDKLESIPGFDTEISMAKFKNNIENCGIGIINQTINVAPVEGKMYKLRNELGFTDSLPIIAASLMSLKLAMGCDKIVFDITCGKGTYLKTKEEARRLAKLLVKLGKRLDKKVACVITNMNEPLGYAIGHELEIKEIISALKGDMSQDLNDVMQTLAGMMMSLVTGQKFTEEDKKRIEDAIFSGEALEKFKMMVASQNGDLRFIEQPECFRDSKYNMPVLAEQNGFIESIDADIVGSIAVYLGAGRMKNQTAINRSAGIVLNKKVGDTVEAGEALAYIHTDDETKVTGAVENLKNAFQLTNKNISQKSRILEIIQ